MVKVSSRQETREEKKNHKSKLKTKKMVIGTCILVITLNEDGLKCPKQKTQTVWMDIKNKTCVYAATRDPLPELGNLQSGSLMQEAQEFTPWLKL